MTNSSLPVAQLKDRLLAELPHRSVVLTAPTGTGKSTEVPRWLPGRVIVVEPRRVACRALAARVAMLEGTKLGELVGYQVRDDSCVSPTTRIVFVTPGVALRQLRALESCDTLVLDEFHERRLDVDLLLGLMHQAGKRLLVMSATVDAQRIAQHLAGVHLEVSAKSFPVEVDYLGQGNQLPDARDLDQRVAAAVMQEASQAGDILVFLPGKGEIERVKSLLANTTRHQLGTLHGGLSLREQAAALAVSDRPRILLATNVAETSLTVPGVRTVIDSGLVRRTRYHQGRGHLTLVAIAEDSAEQRRGRAGRTAPGRCLRLWARSAQLRRSTPPEVYRESLTEMVLAAAACGRRLSDLPLLDAPEEHALSTAEQELQLLGALDSEGQLTATGDQLFGLPLQPFLARLLIEAKGSGDAVLLEAAIDWAAALAVNSPLFVGSKDRLLEALPRHVEPYCDASHLICALRDELGDSTLIHSGAQREAQLVRQRLRAYFGLDKSTKAGRFDRAALLGLMMRADPRSVYVARRRKARLAFSNGGTEIELSRDSQAGADPKLEAIVVGQTRALGLDLTRARVMATSASSIPLSWLNAAKLGRERVAGVSVEDGAVVANLESVYAKRVLARTTRIPEGPLAREAMLKLLLERRVFSSTVDEARERLANWLLLERLQHTPRGGELGLGGYCAPAEDLGVWFQTRLQDLGFETGSDLALLDENDLLPPPLPAEVRSTFESEFPRHLDLGDARYHVEYRLTERLVFLRLVSGARTKPPPLSFLPQFQGFKIAIEAGGTVHRLR